MNAIYKEQESVADSYVRLYVLAEAVAQHLGHNRPVVDYNPMRDPDVLAFMEQAVHNEIASESQEARALDALDREV